MVEVDIKNVSLGDAVSHYLAKLSPEERNESQAVIFSFVRWYGWERPFISLTAPEIANYAEQLSLSDTDYDRKFELLRAFLTYAKKEGWSKTNLATHLKAKKARNLTSAQGKTGLPEAITLTRQGYTELEAELAELKQQRHQVIEEMRRAAADKDFRENAPLAAAREQRSFVEGRIRELEETLKLANIADNEPRSTFRVNIGDKVIMTYEPSGEEVHYIIVHPSEVDATHGKISSASPLGKAVLGRGEGETVEVTVPAGKHRYQIKRIER